MSEWRNFFITELADFCNAQRIPLSSMERVHRKGNFPYYGASGIVDYIDNYIFDGSYILISEDGENLKSRKTPIAFEATGKFWVNNHAHILIAKKPHLTELIIQYFSQLDLSPYLTGAAQPKLNKASLNLIPLYLPVDELEQKAIASVLSSLEDKIDLLHRQNRTLESMAETLFRQWFIEGFENKKMHSDIKKLIKLQSGYAFKSKDFTDTGMYKVIKIKNISGNVVDINETDFLDTEVGETLAERFHLKSGHVLIAMTGAEIGKLGLIPKNNEKLLLNQRVGLIKPQFHGSEYLAYLYLNSETGQDYIQNAATGSAQPNISASQIESCPFPEINIESLKHHAKEIKIYFDKVVDNLGSIKTLEKIRDTLLPKLMSGEVKVQYAEEAIASVA